MTSATTLMYLLVIPLLWGNVIAGSLSMDEAGYCRENKEAVYNGTGRSITIRLDGDGEENPVVITSNAQDPISRGGFQFELISSTPVSDQPFSLLTFQINITYTMTSAISGQILRFSTTREDQVSGQTIIQSCNSCLLPIDVYQKNLDLSVSWKHPACCGWDGELDYTVMLECMNCGTALNKSTRLMNVSFSSLPTGMYRASVMAKNSCGENISNYTTVNHSAKVYSHAIRIPDSTGCTLFVVAMAAIGVAAVVCILR